MGVEHFSQWANAQTFPYKPSSTRAKAIRRGHKRLRLGMSVERVKERMPEPDWSVETEQGCVWKYATEMSGKTLSDHGHYKAISVRFSDDNIVREIGSGDPWEFVAH